MSAKIPIPFELIPIFNDMEYQIFSYRFAQEIIQHRDYRKVLKDILTIIKECPSYIYLNKSSQNSKLDVVQQLLNTYFDRRFACDHGWDYHPDATTIHNSDLKADYRTEFKGLRIQAEVQFGNIARWYTDIFKFQTAYSQDMIDMGLSIVPLGSLAKRIDSNIANYERCTRELPSAKLSISLPILIIGLFVDGSTTQINVSKTSIGRNIANITGKGKVMNRYRIVNGYLNDRRPAKITDRSDPGPMPTKGIDSADLDSD
jgi:hypothetical protein